MQLSLVLLMFKPIKHQFTATKEAKDPVGVRLSLLPAYAFLLQLLRSSHFKKAISKQVNYLWCCLGMCQLFHFNSQNLPKALSWFEILSRYCISLFIDFLLLFIGFFHSLEFSSASYCFYLFVLFFSMYLFLFCCLIVFCF